MLPNGVRYAVRRNGVPPGQVAVRVRIDAGSLMEKDGERGYAHLLEHLSFRGSTFVPDGDSKRIWQRLGVTFGSDSNASTSFTQTVYNLDLPDADDAGLDESFKILAGMMSGPTITPESLGAERPVVMAEAREQPGPQVRWTDAMFELMFSGQPLAQAQADRHHRDAERRDRRERQGIPRPLVPARARGGGGGRRRPRRQARGAGRQAFLRLARQRPGARHARFRQAPGRTARRA